MSFGPRPIDPDLQDLLQAHRDQYELQHRGPMPGRVESYDAATQTANVLPLLNYPVPQGDGTVVWEECPVVPSVPVVFPRSAGWFIAHRLDPGDTVLLIPLEGSAGAWRAGDGAPQDPDDLRRHHLAGCVAVPGLFVRSKALTRAPGPNGAEAVGLTIGHDTGTRLELRTDGSVRLVQGSAIVLQVDANGTVHLAGAAGDLVALATRVDAELTALRAAISAAVIVPNDGGAALKASMLGWTPGTVGATKTRAT
jgi:hypothetical protein